MTENRNIIRSERLGKEYEYVKHPSGLSIYMCPMEGFNSAYAMFATKYGSVDNMICKKGEESFEKLPEGIAHYLEHKLFESEDGDAFQRYAATGASANAFTAFDCTAYLFSCTDNFKESLEILLDFVTHPFFTAETVAKEQGIIGQEIRMYDDNADWQVLFRLLGAMYHNNPVRTDIAGTVESIANINADLLYKCYNTFYNLRNMVLVVAGKFERDEVLSMADKILTSAPPLETNYVPVEEPREVKTQYTEKHLPISTPIFQIGFKGKAGEEGENSRGSVLDEIFVELLCGEASPLYRSLYDEGLINSTFGTEVFTGRDHISIHISGESRNSKKVLEKVKEEFSAIIQNGITNDDFEAAQKSVYGNYVRMGEKITSMASALVSCHFAGVNPFELCEIVAKATPKMVLDRAKQVYSPEYTALSVILPTQE